MFTDRRRFLKQLSTGAAGIYLSPILANAFPHSNTAGMNLLRSTPEREGISSASIMDFIENVEKNNLGLHSLMIVRHGKVIAEGWWDPYKPGIRHMMFSLSKSFVSTAVGLAISEGRLKVEDKLTSFFASDLPQNIGSNMAAIHIKDLLTMNTGHATDTLPVMRKQTQSWVKTFLSLEPEHKPGTFFFYNSGATYMLSAVLQMLTGKTVLDYLKPRVLDPLQITGADWEVSPQGVNAGAYGLRIKTEDIARFGQFYLQKGVWNGKQLLSAKWVEEATSYQVPNAAITGKDETSDWQQGYGYQFWRCRHNVYRGDGAVGQFCIVMPEHDAVVAITSETPSMQGILNAVWDHILPGIKTGPLAENKTMHDSLQSKLASLTMLPSAAITSSPVATVISGKPFKLQPNEMNAMEITFTFNSNTCTFLLKDDNGPHSVTCGLGHWIKGETLMPGDPVNLVSGYNKPGTKSKVAASAEWKNENTFVMTWSFFETPHSDVVTCHFENNRVRIEFKNSLALKLNIKENRPVLEGQV